MHTQLGYEIHAYYDSTAVLNTLPQWYMRSVGSGTEILSVQATVSSPATRAHLRVVSCRQRL